LLKARVLEAFVALQVTVTDATMSLWQVQFGISNIAPVVTMLRPPEVDAGTLSLEFRYVSVTLTGGARARSLLHYHRDNAVAAQMDSLTYLRTVSARKSMGAFRLRVLEQE